MGTEYITDGSKVFVGEYDASCALNTADINHARTLVNLRTLCGNNMKATRNHDPTVSWGGFGLYGADLWDDKSFSLMTDETNDTPLGIIIGNDAAAGSWGREVLGYMDSRTDTYNIAEAIGINGGWFGEYIARVIALNIDEAVTGTGAETGQNFGAIAEGTTSICVLRVTAETSLTSMTVQINESSDDGSADAYAQPEGWTISVGGNASAGTNDVDFTGTGWAVLTGTAAREAWMQLETTAFTGTSATVQATYGEVAG